MPDPTTSVAYYSQLSHASRPGTLYSSTTASATTGSFAGLVAVTDTRFYSLTSSTTGMSGFANTTIGSATTIPGGTYLPGDVSSFRLHTGLVLAIGS
jgi:hypothetical protein